MRVLGSKVNKSRLVIAARNYRKLRESGELAKIQDDLRMLSLMKVLQKENLYSTKNNLELSYRQFLVSRLFNRNLNHLLLSSLNKPGKFFSYPLPKQWIDYLNENGYKVRRRRSSMLFFLFNALVNLHRLKKCLGLLCKKNTLISEYHFSYFIFNPPKNGMHLTKKNKIVNILDWMVKNKTNSKILIGHQNSKIKNKKTRSYSLEYTTAPIIMNSNNYLGRLNVFVRSFLKSFSIAPLKLFYIYDFFVNSLVVNKQGVFYDEYIVSNSDYIYRPSWSILDRNFDSSFNMFFYSLNCVDFGSKAESFLPRYGGEIALFDNIYVWPNHHLSILKNFNKNSPKYLFHGPLPFEGRDVNLTKSSKMRIAVFDIAINRKSSIHSTCHKEEYLTMELANKFYTDILNSVEGLDIELIIKPKRTHANLSKRYFSLLQSLKANPKIKVLESDISPFALIAQVDAVICMPMTSVFHIFEANKIPSVYYDASSQLYFDKSFNKRSYCNSLPELKRWIREIV